MSCYPSTFDPNKKHERVEEEGEPAFEPQLKAGGHWHASLKVPQDVRDDAQHSDASKRERKSFTWIIELASQIIFSKTASVNFEVLVGRDEKSVDLGFHGVIGSGQGAPGRLEDHQQGRSRNAAHPKGVFSKAVKLVVDDTESLWNSPPFPEWDENRRPKMPEQNTTGDNIQKDDSTAANGEQSKSKQKKIHLVLLTHGLHSNVGADMLYMKECIDRAAKQAREDKRKRRAQRRGRRMTESFEFGRQPLDKRSQSVPEIAITGTEGMPDEAVDKEPAEDDPDVEDEEDEEQILVRGFGGNVTKTERGIQWLGKRFAKYVLSITYPDQPYLPVKTSMGKSLAKTLSVSKPSPKDSTTSAHKRSSIIKDEDHQNHNLPYKITSISFISHSLGGLIQTYAVAYIQKHSPEFFNLIKPINFVAMASPFLGLSNENPVYVKFGLDFGLVGRSGQDLGLSWRAPTALAKSGWGAVIGGLTNDSNKGEKEPDPGTKPLLRILPTGPAHVALKKFRNRTVYSNVVNDGIVPLRTSCLLFLDWRGLGRVDKARRESGLVGTMVGWGWAEMMGQNASDPRKAITWNNLFSDSGEDVSKPNKSAPDLSSSVPEAQTGQALDDDEPADNQFLDKAAPISPVSPVSPMTERSAEPEIPPSAPNLWTELLNFFKPHAGHHVSPPSSPKKSHKIYRRGQTMPTCPHEDSGESSREHSQEGNDDDDEDENGRRRPVRGSSVFTNNSDPSGDVQAPPKTTFFESAADVLSPPLPPKDFILDPAERPRTIFHDRVYHPEDIPPPPAKRQRTFMIKRSSSRDGSQQSLLSVPNSPIDARRPASGQFGPSNPPVGTMKIEEKIARAYHKDLSWRKVLVRLEPDAHNNIIVRRMFANAYGWPVVKHMCDTHFAFTAAALTRDDEEPTTERARPRDASIGAEGESVKGQTDQPPEEIETQNSKNDGEEDRPVHPQTTDDASLPDKSPQEIDVIHEEMLKLQTQWKTRERNKPTHQRTESELREARDDVSELVSRVSAAGESSFSSMNSGKAALARIQRQDSGRWSDHFFDGSDDGDDDDDDEDEGSGLVEEMRKAKYRGELDKAFNIDFDVGSSAKIAQSLTASPKTTRINLPKKKRAEGSPGLKDGHMVTDADTPFSDEPAELEPLSPSPGSNTDTPVGEPSTELEPGSITSLSTATGGLGLGLTEIPEERPKPESRHSPDGRRGRQTSLGVAEQVARAQARSQDRLYEVKPRRQTWNDD